MTNSVSRLGSFFLVLIMVVASCGGEVTVGDTATYTARDGESLEMDVYGAEPQAMKPAVLYFHGGSWISGSRSKIHQRYREEVLRWLVGRGVVVFSVDYRLVGLGRGHLEGAVEDCRDAVEFVVMNGDKFGVDTANIGLWGSSAGAHLAMVAAFADTVTARRVKFLIDDFGPVDIHEMFDKVPTWGRYAMSDIVFDIDGKSLEKFDSLTSVYSPINYDSKMPVLIFHGEDDNVVNIGQSRKLHEKMAGNSHFVSFRGNGHGLKDLDSVQLKVYMENFANFLDTVI